jgi:hypothetical protein
MTKKKNGFSSSIGWNIISVEIIEEIKECNCMWEYYGKIITDENYADPETGWRNAFFIMKSEGQWKYRIEPDTFIYEGYWGPVKSHIPKMKFSLFGEMKIYMNEKKNWANECDFIKRYNEREPLSQSQILDRFLMKYEEIFRWLLVEFNEKEIFGENIRMNHADEKIDCYEGRYEEIVNSCTDVSRRNWKNQKGIEARSRRIQLFLSDLFKQRRTQKSDGS